MDPTTERQGQDRRRSIQRTTMRAYINLIRCGRSYSAASAESGVGEEETQQRVRRPVTVVAAGGSGWGEEGAVSAVEGFDVTEAGVREDGGAALGEGAQKGIVQSMEDQRRRGDAMENAGGGGAGVVAVRAGEA